jgi:hypothetical protein
MRQVVSDGTVQAGVPWCSTGGSMLEAAYFANSADAKSGDV